MIPMIAGVLFTLSHIIHELRRIMSLFYVKIWLPQKIDTRLEIVPEFHLNSNTFYAY